MPARSCCAWAAVLLLTPVGFGYARAQDVVGLEICTVEKAMERRTSCLQSNVEFLQKQINKLTLDHQQKLDAANRQIEALKASLAGLQQRLSELPAAREKTGEDVNKKAGSPAVKDPQPATKDK